MLQFLVSMLSIVRQDREAGATMVEYGLLVALIAIIVAVAAALLGSDISDLFSSAATSVNP